MTVEQALLIGFWCLATSAWLDVYELITRALVAMLRAARRHDARMRAATEYVRSIIARQEAFDVMNAHFDNNYELLDYAEQALERIVELIERGDLRDAVHECERAHEEINGGALRRPRVTGPAEAIEMRNAA